MLTASHRELLAHVRIKSSQPGYGAQRWSLTHDSVIAPKFFRTLILGGGKLTRSTLIPCSEAHSILYQNKLKLQRVQHITNADNLNILSSEPP